MKIELFWIKLNWEISSTRLPLMGILFRGSS